MNAQTKVTGGEAPIAFQAEVLRGQVCDDLNRRFNLERERLLRDFADRKDEIDRDYNRLSAEAFKAKYIDWKFL